MQIKPANQAPTIGADVLVFHDIIKSDPESRKLHSGRQEVGANTIRDLTVTTS